MLELRGREKKRVRRERTTERRRMRRKKKKIREKVNGVLFFQFSLKGEGGRREV